MSSTKIFLFPFYLSIFFYLSRIIILVASAWIKKKNFLRLSLTFRIFKQDCSSIYSPPRARHGMSTQMNSISNETKTISSTTVLLTALPPPSLFPPPSHASALPPPTAAPNSSRLCCYPVLHMKLITKQRLGTLAEKPHAKRDSRKGRPPNSGCLMRNDAQVSGALASV